MGSHESNRLNYVYDFQLGFGHDLNDANLSFVFVSYKKNRLQ